LDDFFDKVENNKAEIIRETKPISTEVNEKANQAKFIENTSTEVKGIA